MLISMVFERKASNPNIYGAHRKKYATITSSNGNIFRVVGLFLGSSTDYRILWQRPVTMHSFMCVWTNCWANNRYAGDFKRHLAHYVTVMAHDSRVVFCYGYIHYNDVIMTTMASQTTSLTVVYSTVYSDADQRKHQSSASLAFVWGIYRDRWIPRTKGQLRGKCFHLMTSSCQSILHNPFFQDYFTSFDCPGSMTQPWRTTTTHSTTKQRAYIIGYVVRGSIKTRYSSGFKIHGI